MENHIPNDVHEPMGGIETLDDWLRILKGDPEHIREQFRQEPYFAVGRDVYNLRKEQGITQRELATQAGTHQSRVSKIESAELDYRISTLVNVAEALDAHVEVHVVRNHLATNREYSGFFTTSVSLSKHSTSKLEMGRPVQLTFSGTSHA